VCVCARARVSKRSVVHSVFLSSEIPFSCPRSNCWQQVMDCMAAADKDLVKVLLRKCEILNWQHSIVSPAINTM